jgi:hypothetical protein
MVLDILKGSSRRKKDFAPVMFMSMIASEARTASTLAGLSKVCLQLSAESVGTALHSEQEKRA